MTDPGKCLKVVNSDTGAVTLGQALMSCSADKSRLVMQDSCVELTQLMRLIYNQMLKKDQTYFIGMFAFEDPEGKSFRNYDEQNIINSFGSGVLEDNSGTVCSLGNQNNLPSGSDEEAFVVMKIINEMEGEVIVENFHMTDYSLPRSQHGYICEKEGN